MLQDPSEFRRALRIMLYVAFHADILRARHVTQSTPTIRLCDMTCPNFCVGGYVGCETVS